jgi:hypothetical protein
MQTLEQYLMDNGRSGAIDHSIRMNESLDGKISFYIHALGKDSVTLDFAVLGNKLIPLQPDIVGQPNKTATQAIEEMKSTYNTRLPQSCWECPFNKLCVVNEYQCQPCLDTWEQLQAKY